MKAYNICIIAFLIGLLVSCAPTIVKTRTGSDLTNEDLSVFRKSYVKESGKAVVTDKVEEVKFKDIPDDYEDIEPSYSLKKEMDSILLIAKASKADVERISGYTIQVFSGKNRGKAFYARDKVYAVLEGSSPSMKYYQPNYQVKVGEYFTQLDALEDFSVLKESFANALIVPYKIPISHIR